MNENMLLQDNFWPTTIYFKDYPNSELFNQDLEEKILAWSKCDPGLAKTNRLGWHSTTDMHTRVEFAGIVNYLIEMQHEIYHAEGLAGTPMLGNMWANINYPGASNAMHIHPNSLWSGVYYVTCNDQSGNIYFEDPRSVSLMSMPKYQYEQNLNSRRIIDSQPKPGRLIMFPSWLNHGVRENTSDKTRISISFNFLQNLK
jgi:uncharacterized protein (TIGR02466 family)